MKDNSLYEVRCPNNRWKGNSNRLTCNTMCGRVSATSMGEFWCRKCKITFHYVVNEDGEVNYFFEPTEIKERFGQETDEDRLMRLVNGE